VHSRFRFAGLILNFKKPVKKASFTSSRALAMSKLFYHSLPGPPIYEKKHHRVPISPLVSALTKLVSSVVNVASTIPSHGKDEYSGS
jgi:hypothetical protein